MRQTIIADLHIEGAQTGQGIERPPTGQPAQTGAPADSVETGPHDIHPRPPTPHARGIAPAAPKIVERDQSGIILGKWLFPSSVSQDAAGAFLDAGGKPTPADTERLNLLRAWMKQNHLEIPIISLLRSSNNQDYRRKAISDLKIQ